MSPVPLGSFDESLRKLWTDCIDLLLIRQSFCFQAKRGRIFFLYIINIFAREEKGLSLLGYMAQLLYVE